MQRTQRGAFGIFLKHQFAVARDFNPELIGQGVHNRHADTVQTARCFIGLAREFTARVQGGQDDLKGRFVREFRMWVGWNTTPVIADKNGVVRSQFQFDPVGVSCDGLIHGVIENLGHQMMQGCIICAPDIHTGAASNGF